MEEKLLGHLILKVLIVAKCIVNIVLEEFKRLKGKVLIVAKCIVNNSVTL